MKRLPRALAYAFGALLIWLVVLAAQIVHTGNAHSETPADVAIVLGAAVYGTEPSPVFEKRIQHGIHLYRSGQVKNLLLTGGYGKGASAAEALVAASYARRSGVPAEAILIETVSRTTHQNLLQAKRVMGLESLKTALIVTDPLHVKRALRMCSGLGIAAEGAPAADSLYRSWRTKAGFLIRELYFYNLYLVTGR